MGKNLVSELRHQFNELVEELTSIGACVRRECMCDMAAPVVKMNDLITKLEQREASPASANLQAALPQG